MNASSLARSWPSLLLGASLACVDPPSVFGGDIGDEVGDEAADDSTTAIGESEGPDEGDDESDEDGCPSSEPALPGPPFVPEVCGTWEPEPLAPANEPPTASCAEGGPCPTFRDVTASAGLLYAQYRPTTPVQGECIFDLPTGQGTAFNADCEPQWSSGGVAVGDYDRDGWPDLYVTRLGAPDLLFRNLGDGSFEDVAAKVGLGACSFTNGAAWADVDDDGDLDLAVTSLGEQAHHLFINHAGCFIDEAEARGFAIPVERLHVGESVTFGDYDLDGILDAHIDEWIDDSLWDEQGAWGSRLLHGLGDGQFEDVTDAAGVAIANVVFGKDGAWGFASSFVDLDDDGWPELVITADFGEPRLFWNAGDGSFVDGTDVAGVADEGNAMGTAFGDYDGDGRLDWFVSAIAEAHPEGCSVHDCLWRATGHRLYRNRGDRTFEDVTDLAGVRDVQAWGWGTNFFDADHDGDLDLVLATGWPGRGAYQTFVHLDTPLRLWMNQGDGTFSEEGQLRGVDDRGQGRGVVTFDYDRDGDLDVFVANHAGRPVLLRNEGGEAVPWLVVEVEGTTSNRDGRGAVVRVQVSPAGPVQVRQIGVAGHFLSETELGAHFGLGAGIDSVHEVRVTWPASGEEVVLHDVPANRRMSVVEP
jgi:hypothetical protein